MKEDEEKGEEIAGESVHLEGCAVISTSPASQTGGG